MATIILGGGIIGLATAFYLSELEPELAADHKIHIVDSASELLLSASGYAGGFLAKDWFSHPSASLGELSFRLHKELAAKYGGSKEWSYAPSMVYSLAANSRGMSKPTGGADWLLEGTSRTDEAPASTNGARSEEMLNEDGSPAWFSKQKDGTLEELDVSGGCAQIEPKQFCRFLLEKCEERGVQVHTNCTASGVFKNADGKIGGVKVRKDTEIYEKHASRIVVAAGAWTPQVFSKLFPGSRLKIPITPLAGYSIVARSPRLSKPIIDPKRHPEGKSEPIAHAVYCGPTSGWGFSPEVFSRIPADGRPELWAGGVNDPELKLPETADAAAALKVREKAEELRSAMIAMTGLSKEGDNLNDNDLDIVREGLCFRPVSRSGVPIISKVREEVLGPDIKFEKDGGVYVASGHGPWGISLSAGTGKVMAEMLLGRKLSADISRLSMR